MQALQYHSYGGPEVLVIGQAAEPHPGPGLIRVRVRAASVNPLEWKLRSGLMSGGRPLEAPGRLGFDASGVVDELGEGVTDVALGDDVFGLGSGTAAELAVLTAYAKKPAAIDWAVAAAAGVATEAAIRVLDLVGVGSGSTVLVDGGAGGVGSVTVQVAVARGASVVATAGEDNLGYLTEIGATGIRYGEGMAERARAAAPGGFDAVVDVAGKTDAAVLVGLVADPARVGSLANFGAADLGIQVTSGGGDPRAAMAEAARLLEQNRLVIKIQTFPLARAAEAHRISEGGHVRGKLVLLP